MKKMILFFTEILVLILMVLPAVTYAGAGKAVLDGSFITGDFCYSWSDARWQQEFTAMKNAGMHYIIIQAIADSYPGKITTTIYPSSLPNTKMATGGNAAYPDVVDACLRNAESAGMKVFIGIDMSTNWWNVYGNDTTWLYSQMDFDNKVCDEVWSLYKAKYPDAFYGWYWSYEVDNLNFKTQAQQNVLTNAMNRQLDHLIAKNEKLPFMWCPFMNSSVGTPAAYQTMWQNVFSGLHTTAGDIFCPQDCVGAGGLKLSEVVSWFSALRQAVDTKSGLVMWSDVETFDISDETSATMDRIVSQLKIEQPYVDNYVTWEYCYYDSPNNIDAGFQNTYIDYLNTGSLDNTAPNVPSNFTAALQLDGDVLMNWDAATDNIGVCGYYVYRNGTMICKKQVPRINDGTSTAQLTKYTNTGLNSNTTYSYQVQAYDFANNVSALTSKINVSTSNMNIVSRGCKYTVSIPANGNYPDPSGKKLTDGNYAATAYYADAAWVGFADVNNIDVVIDLGKSVPVQYFIADYLLDVQPAVYLPKEVKVLISTDNSNFTDAGTLSLNSTYDSAAAMCKYYCALSNPVNARYVKFSTTSSGYWTFCDEYEVRNNNTTGIDGEETLPGKYSLSQNYPNPFNPSTIIKYQILKAGSVTLKIYDVLGKEIKTLVNEEKAAGSYSVNFNASLLANGVYFYQIKSGGFTATKKMILLK
jgi:chitodextrinase